MYIYIYNHIYMYVQYVEIEFSIIYTTKNFKLTLQETKVKNEHTRRLRTYLNDEGRFCL